MYHILHDEYALQVAPGTLDALMPALGEHPSLTVPRGRGEVVIDCSKVKQALFSHHALLLHTLLFTCMLSLVL
jgi:hypothetical protein